MGSWKITFFEYHSHDGHLDLFSSTGDDESEESAEAGEEEAGGSRAMEAVIGLVLLVAIGMAIRYVRSDDTSLEEESHPVSVTEYEE